MATIHIESEIKEEFETLFKALYGAKPSTSDYLESQMATKIAEMKSEMLEKENVKKVKK